MNNITELINLAKKVRENAYAPYSKFAVGAALLAASGKIYTGCNMENATFGATICAERAALSAAIAAGERAFQAIAVVADAENISPCGICRQQLSEFSPAMDVHCASMSGTVKSYKLNDLLPNAFLL